MNNIVELKKGIKTHFIKTDKYKTDLCCIFLTLPIKRETVTKTALIPFMLRRGTKRLPNQNLINKEMENMYGAEFNCGIDKMGDNIVLKFYIESIGNDYALNGENVLEMNISNLLEIVFDPALENGRLSRRPSARYGNKAAASPLSSSGASPGRVRRSPLRKDP